MVYARLNALDGKLHEVEELVHRFFKAAITALGQDPPYDGPIVIDGFALVAGELRDACIRFIALDKPVASDLKLAVAAIKIGHDYERIFELVVAINKRAKKLGKSEAVSALSKAGSAALALHSIIVCRSELKEDSVPMFLNACEESYSVASILVDAAQEKVKEIMSSAEYSAEVKIELVLVARHIKRILAGLQDIANEMVVMKPHPPVPTPPELKA